MMNGNKVMNMTMVKVEIQDRNKFQVNKDVNLQCTSCVVVTAYIPVLSLL